MTNQSDYQTEKKNSREYNPDHSSSGEPSRRLSKVLKDIADNQALQDVSFVELIAILGGRGRAALILLFAFPNIFPAPPGLSSLLGLPLLYLSMQMMLGRLPWLPAIIGERRISRERFSQLVQKIAPYLARAEELLRSRHSYLAGHTAERPLGLLCFVLAVILALPIPLGNMLPALSMCLMALGILERDGVWVSVGVVTGIISLIVVAAVFYTMIKAAIFVIINVLI